MSPLFDRIPSPPARATRTGGDFVTGTGTGADGGRRFPEDAVPALLGGVVAAGLGLGALAVAVLFLWITAPFPDSGLDGALRVAADLWLLAHGADLIRTETLSGAPAPVGVTPLLLTALPVWLLYRAAAEAVTPPGGGPAPGPREAAVAVGRVVAGYLVVAAGAVFYTASGTLRSDPLGAALLVPLVVALAAGAGGWAACGWPPPPLPRFAGGLPPALPPGGLSAALRAGGAATAVLTGGGALFAAVSLVWHAHRAEQSFAQLSASASGRVAVCLVAVALVPNAAVWGASYALGPGFAVGAGSTVAPAGAGGYPVLPNFPLLSAVPQPGPGTSLSWAALALPVLAGAVVAWFAGARASAEGWTMRATAAVAGLAAVGCGVALAALTAFGTGPMGAGTLARFGPSWWAAGMAALGWTAVVGVPGALAARGRNVALGGLWRWSRAVYGAAGRAVASHRPAAAPTATPDPPPPLLASPPEAPAAPPPDGA